MAYLGVIEPAGQIIVQTSEETITFAVSTAGATLKHSLANYIIVEEANFGWYIYDNRMYRWQKTGSATTGMSGNSYSAQQISGNSWWFPLTADENTNAASITAELQVVDKLTLTSGSLVSDLTLPASILGDGFAADGAIHIETTAGYLASITWNSDFTAPSVVLNDFVTQFNSTDVRINIVPMDDNAANSTLTAKLGANGRWADRSSGAGNNVNTNTSSIAGLYRGTSLDNQNSFTVRLEPSIHTSAFMEKGSFLIKIIPQWPYNSSSYYRVGEVYSDNNNLIQIMRHPNDKSYFAQYKSGGSSSYNNRLPRYANEASIRTVQTILLSWNGDLLSLAFDHKLESMTPITVSSLSVTPITISVSNDASGASDSDIWIDEVRTFSEMILPLGARQTHLAQDSTGAAAHPSISFYDDLANIAITSPGIGSPVAVVGTPVLSTGPQGTEGALEFPTGANYISCGANISGTAGCVSFWHKSNSSFIDNTLHYVFGKDSGVAGDIHLAKTASNALIFTVRDSTNGVHSTTYDIDSFPDQDGIEWDTWNYWEIIWDSADTVDGTYHMALRVGGWWWTPASTVSISAPWTPADPASFAIGSAIDQGASSANATMKGFCAQNEGREDIAVSWSALGIELDAPALRVNGALQRYGVNYELEWQTDGSIQVTTPNSVVATDIWDFSFDYTPDISDVAVNLSDVRSTGTISKSTVTPTYASVTTTLSNLLSTGTIGKPSIGWNIPVSLSNILTTGFITQTEVVPIIDVQLSDLLSVGTISEIDITLHHSDINLRNLVSSGVISKASIDLSQQVLFSSLVSTSTITKTNIGADYYVGLKNIRSLGFIDRGIIIEGQTIDMTDVLSTGTISKITIANIDTSISLKNIQSTGTIRPVLAKPPLIYEAPGKVIIDGTA